MLYDVTTHRRERFGDNEKHLVHLIAIAFL